ncbi:MAG: hypothetical protein AB2693_31265 [Candidatus Thiodiazotropha sp.]
MSEKTYTTLEPVASSNVDFEETLVKQLYTPEHFDGSSTIDCGQRVTSYVNLNISSRNLVNVTPENVESVFDELSSANPLSETVENTIKLYRDLPKDYFIARIISDYDSDDNKLKAVRNQLFVEVKSLEEFPFSSASELKRRNKPKLGESAALKLGGDIYILASVLEGASFDDLKDLISSTKINSDTLNQSTYIVESGTEPVRGASCKCDADLAQFRGLLADIQGDILTLKHQHDEMKNNHQEEINSVKSDLKTLQSDIVTAVNELHDTASFCRQSIENLTDDHCNGVARVKSDVKQIRGELQSMYEYIELKDTELCNKIYNINMLEKRIAKLESKVEKKKQPPNGSLYADKSSVDIIVTPSSHTHNAQVQVDNASDRKTTATFQAEPYTTERRLPADSDRTSETSTSFQKTKLIRCPETKLFKRVPATVSGDITVDSVTPCASDSSANCYDSRGPPNVYDQTKLRNLDQDTKNAGTINSFRPDSVLAADQSASSMCNNVNSNDQNDNTLYYDCSVTNRFSALQSRSGNLVPGVASFSDVVKGDPLHSQSSIPVHVSNRQRKTLKSRSSNVTKSYTVRSRDIDDASMRTEPDSDDDFVQYVRRRPARYYVGGFKSSITEQKLVNYVLRRGITVSRINILRYEDQDRAVIQLSVDAEHGPRLLERGFWPPGVFSRPWYSRNEYSQRNNAMQLDSYATGRVSGSNYFVD